MVVPAALGGMQLRPIGLGAVTMAALPAIRYALRFPLIRRVKALRAIIRGKCSRWLEVPGGLQRYEGTTSEEKVLAMELLLEYAEFLPAGFAKPELRRSAEEVKTAAKAILETMEPHRVLH